MASDGHAVVQLGSEITLQLPDNELGPSSPIWDLIHREQENSESHVPFVFAFVAVGSFVLVATFVLLWFHGLREVLHKLSTRRA